jgi:hypothetical protein
MGFSPRFTIKPISASTPEAENCLTRIQRIREEVTASQTIADNAMKATRGRYGTSYPTLKEGNQVWLDGKNLKLRYPKIKLTPKRYGPFPITKVLVPVNYRLKLPRTWRIHPTFHLSLLILYKETPEHGPIFTKPPPDLIEGKPEYEVETIVNSKV